MATAPKRNMIRVIPQADRIPLPNHNQHNMYMIQPIEPLRQVDTNVTLLAALLGKKNDIEFNHKFIKLTRQLTPLFFIANMIYAAIVMPSFVLLDNPTYWLIGCLFSLLVVLPSNLIFTGTISYDVFCLITETFGFRYLTIINCMNQIIWLFLFRDPARFLGFLAGTIGCEMALLTDAMFHLRRHAARSLAVASILSPWYVILIRLGVAPRQADITFTIWGLRLDLIDGFVYNLFVTVWLLAGKAWPLMRLLLPNSNVDQVVCEMYYPKSKLVLVETTLGMGPGVSRWTDSGTGLRNTSSRCRSKPSVIKRSLEVISNDADQQVDESKQIASPIILEMLNRYWYIKVHSVIGWIGLSAWAIAITWHVVNVKRLSQDPFMQIFLAKVGFILSFVYCVVSAAHCQSKLVTQLMRQADAWFVSVQFTIFTLIVCDVLYWDDRCIFVWTSWLWCHWMILLDALTPYSRRHLRYQRWMVITTELLLFLYPLIMSYWIYFSRDNTLFNREYSHSLFHKLTVHVRMRSMLASQVFDMLIWMGRFLWQEFYRPQHVLKFIKQHVQYSGTKIC